MVKKPWGHEVILNETDLYVVKQIYVKKDCRLSQQYHKNKTETMIAISGGAFLELYDINGKTMWYRYMEPYRPYFIPPYCTHRLMAKHSDAVVLEVSTPELDDVVRTADDYGRVEVEEEDYAF